MLVDRPPSAAREVGVGGARENRYASPLVTSAAEGPGAQQRMLPLSASKGAFPIPPPAAMGGRPAAVGNQVSNYY